MHDVRLDTGDGTEANRSLGTASISRSDAATAQVVDAWLAARLFALDPAGVGGIVVRARPGPVRDRWLAELRARLPASMPWRVVPVHVDRERLLGGLDLAATLQQGRPVASRGLLAEADGGVIVLSMAERASGSTAAQVAAALDTGEVAGVRHGIDPVLPARFGVIALDESDGDDAPLAPALLDRLALVVDLRDVAWRELGASPATVDGPGRSALAAAPGVDAREASSTIGGSVPNDGGAAEAHAGVDVSASSIEALCAAACALGIGSIRASLLAARVARLLARSRGAREVDAGDAALAARLVLSPRATQRPATSGDDRPAHTGDSDDETGSEDDQSGARDDGRDGPDPEPDREADPDIDADADVAEPMQGASRREEGDALSAPAGDERGLDPAQPLEDVVLAAAAAAIPPRLLERLGEGLVRQSTGPAGRAGAAQAHGRHGRPAGIRRSRPGHGARLDIIATLRAAAPWQRVRGRPEPVAGSTACAPVRVRGEDFHVTRFIQRGRTTTIFAVDASGSAALHRLAETKGAVELLLADCYVRRDSVAVIAFRGRGAELLLPPTRSLVRAKRSLAGLAGGGGTPLGAGLDAATALSDVVRRRGDTPVVVVLSDGRANVGRDGAPGRARAEADAQAAARALRSQSISVLFIDTSPQPQASARDLAVAMGARYVPLPHAEANALSAAVRAGTAGRTDTR
ncbi:MAG TPA: magnesium chelatase subunit D [Caldimonas sp.]|nr:magnesium chelatase subunit D [Caldimonas sp.]